MDKIIEIIVLLLLSSVKFALAVGYMLFNKGFGYWETVAILMIGGSLGVLAFYFFGEWIMHKWKTFRNAKSTPKKFTKTNRFIVKVRKKYGLIGLALITPVLLSIPVGCIIAARYYRFSYKVILYLLASVVFWSFLLPLLSIYYKS
jgi:membrane protein DedA with SNARE-associated domain